MILVTLGTHPMPMDRLVHKLDSLVEDGSLADEVVVQTAALSWRPSHLTVHNVLEFDQLQGLIRQARIVVTHAGPGNLAAIAAAGKPAVIVPRDERHGEHVDRHQRDYAARIAGRPGCLVVEDISALGQALAAAETMPGGETRRISTDAVLHLQGLFRGCHQ